MNNNNIEEMIDQLFDKGYVVKDGKTMTINSSIIYDLTLKFSPYNKIPYTSKSGLTLKEFEDTQQKQLNIFDQETWKRLYKQ